MIANRNIQINVNGIDSFYDHVSFSEYFLDYFIKAYLRLNTNGSQRCTERYLSPLLRYSATCGLFRLDGSSVAKVVSMSKNVAE